MVDPFGCTPRRAPARRTPMWRRGTAPPAAPGGRLATGSGRRWARVHWGDPPACARVTIHFFAPSLRCEGALCRSGAGRANGRHDSATRGRDNRRRRRPCVRCPGASQDAARARSGGSPRVVPHDHPGPVQSTGGSGPARFRRRVVHSPVPPCAPLGPRRLCIRLNCGQKTRAQYSSNPRILQFTETGARDT